MPNEAPPAPADPLDELERLLDEIALDDDVMLLGEVDGMLAALLVLPVPVAQAEWLPLVWGGADEPVPDEAQARRLGELLLARKAAVAIELLRGSAAYEPIYEIDPRDDVPLWEIWIEGFAAAVELRREAWLTLLDSADAAAADAAISLTALMAIVRESPASKDVPAEAAELIPEWIETLYRHQRGLDRPDLPWAITAPVKPTRDAS